MTNRLQGIHPPPSLFFTEDNAHDVPQKKEYASSRLCTIFERSFEREANCSVMNFTGRGFFPLPRNSLRCRRLLSEDECKNCTKSRSWVELTELGLKKSDSDREHCSALPPFFQVKKKSNYIQDLFQSITGFVTPQEITDVEEMISVSMVDTMDKFFNKHHKNQGIWYPNDYEKFLSEEESKLDRSFNEGFANPKYFKKTDRFKFELISGKKASKALMSFLTGPTVADCANAYVVCFYMCIFRILGVKFDEIFSSSAFPLTIGQNLMHKEMSPISPLIDFTDQGKLKRKGVLGKRPLRIGDVCHFKGVRWYGDKHPLGFYRGFNVIYVSNNEEGVQLFNAHGLTTPLTEKEIYRILLTQYNEERTSEEEQHAAFLRDPERFDRERNPHLKSHYTISPEEFEKDMDSFTEGYIAPYPVRLKAKALIRLIKADKPLECMLSLWEADGSVY